MTIDDQSEGRLTLAAVEALKNKGLNQSEIAEMYGVTKQYVSWIKYTYGGRLTPREQVLKEFPFDVPERMTQATQYKLLRHHGEFVATGGVGMNPDKLKRLRSWYRKLRGENLVVEFDPALPPEPGVCAVGGFTYRQRQPEDSDLLIRVNKHTRLTDEGKATWRLPRIEP